MARKNRKWLQPERGGRAKEPEKTATRGRLFGAQEERSSAETSGRGRGGLTAKQKAGTVDLRQRVARTLRWRISNLAELGPRELWLVRGLRLWQIAGRPSEWELHFRRLCYYHVEDACGRK